MKTLTLALLVSSLFAMSAEAHICQSNPDAAFAQIERAAGISAKLDANSLNAKVAAIKADVDSGNISGETRAFVNNLAAITVIYKNSIRSASSELALDRGNSVSLQAVRVVRDFTLVVFDMMSVTMDLVKAGMQAKIEGRTLSEQETQPYLNQLTQVAQRAQAFQARVTRLSQTMGGVSDSEKESFGLLMKSFEQRMMLNVCVSAHAKFVR